LFAFGVEVGGGFELEAEFFVGLAFVVVEDEGVGGDGEGEGEVAEHVEGGRGGAGFVAADLGDVDADSVREGLLGEAALVACGGESFGEAHEVGDGGGVGGVTIRGCSWGSLT
jgi:hypothetical protein